MDLACSGRECRRDLGWIQVIAIVGFDAPLDLGTHPSRLSLGLDPDAKFAGHRLHELVQEIGEVVVHGPVTMISMSFPSNAVRIG